MGPSVQEIRHIDKVVRDRTTFDVRAFLGRLGRGEKIIELRKRQTIFSQGDASDAVFYIQKGKFKLTVCSTGGKEATIALLSPGEFVGEGCVGGKEPSRLATATALTAATVFKIDRKEMVKVLNREDAFSWFFISYLLARNNRFQEDLIDQLFNSSERRLARALLLLVGFGQDGASETIDPKISQETLAEMIGTTRSRVSFFMNRFRKLGYIDYNGTLRVHRSLLNVLLHD